MSTSRCIPRVRPLTSKVNFSGGEDSDEVRSTFARMTDHLRANGVDLATLLKREYRKPFVVPSESEL